MAVNDDLYDKVVVTDAGDSATMKPGMIITLRKLRDENSQLKRKDLVPRQVRDVIPATSNQVLQGLPVRRCRPAAFHVGGFVPGNDQGAERSGYSG